MKTTRIFCSLLAALVLATQAGAQLKTVGPSVPGSGHGSQRASTDEYIYDDGVSENAVGLGGDCQLPIAWIHHFNRQAGSEVLTAISTTFGTPAFPGGCGCANGQAFQVHVWSDPNGDGSPTDAVLLGSAADVISVGVENDVFQKTAIGPINLPASFFIGAATFGCFPGPVDETIENTDAWLDFNGDPYDPNLVAGATNLDSVVAGVWLLRANAEPTEPTEPIPTFTRWGLLGLTVLLVSGLAIKFGRRRTAMA